MITQEQLDQHALWLRTFGKEGARLVLRGADLRLANLRLANLRLADLRDAYLTDVTGLEVDS